MARKVTIVPYTVRLKDVSEHKYVRLDRLNKGLSLKSLVEQYMTLRSSTAVLPEEQSGIKAEPPIIRGSVIDGIIKSGEYGFSSELENIRTWSTYARSQEDVELFPLYYLLKFKPKQTEAILLLQKFGTSGVKTVLQSNLGDFIEQQLPDLRLEVNALVNEDFIENALLQGAEELHFLRFSVPADVAEEIGAEDHKELEGKMKLSVSLKGRKLNIAKLRLGETDLSGMIEINGVGYTKVKAEILIDGKRRTVDLGKPDNLKMKFDVHEDLVFQKNGHPFFDSLRTEAEKLLPLIEEGIRWRTEDDDKN